MKKNNRILITGGAGFIGSHLCDYLLDHGFEVIVIDNMSSGHKKNIAHIINNIDFYENDIEAFELSQLERIDCVVHLAAQTSVPKSISHLNSSSSSNLIGFINILNFCRVNFVPLVFASSAAVYGNLPFGDDSTDNVELLSPYAVDKYAMELYAKMANSVYGLSSIALRFFNVYGERQDSKSRYSGVISVFIDQMLNKKEIIIYGGFQTRDFIYVGDAVRSIFNAINIVIDQNVCNQFNILTGMSVSIDHLFNLLSNILDYSLEPNYKELTVGDPAKSGGTVKKLNDELSLDSNSFTSLEDGLLKTIKSHPIADFEKI